MNVQEDNLEKLNPTTNLSYSDDKSYQGKIKSRVGLIVCGAFGFAGLFLVALTTPFVLPALRKHCLPYVPATDQQLSNLSKAFSKHAKRGGKFLDIGSGDGRICRLAHEINCFSEIHGVELNYMLVLYSRFMAIKSSHYRSVKYFHKNLWRFPTAQYDSICIFGVESMMQPLEIYLKDSNTKAQLIFACRFPFKNMTFTDEIGSGIDTVWVYKLPNN